MVDPLVLDDGLRVAADLPILKDVVVVAQRNLSESIIWEKPFDKYPRSTS